MQSGFSIRDHFFRMTARIGISATVVAALGIIAISFTFVRHHTIDHFHSATQNAASAFELFAVYKNFSPFEHYMRHLAQYEEFTLVCAYDAGNQLVAKWQMAEGNKCPKHMIEGGITTDILTIYIAEPVEQGGKYLGMIYAEGKLITPSFWLINGSMLLIGLLLICWLTCRLIAHWNARSVTAQLAEIQGQIECLKGNDIAFCTIPPDGMMTEIAKLSEAVLSLRAYLDETKVSKEVIVDLKRWYWRVLSGLLANLRHFLNADSPLLETLSDYALLMQIERGDILPPARSFDIAQVLDNALSAARKSNPVSAQINLTASLQSKMPRQWIGHPELLETLLRHMLLIGLKRTYNGLVCMRLQAVSDTRLHIAFEDSGPSIQPWQLTQWLAPAHEDTRLTGMTDDISWLLISRLFRQLKGNISGTSSTAGGLILEGSLPLESDVSSFAARETSIIQEDREQLFHPLALVVEKEPVAEQKISNSLMEASYRTFTVTTHAEALEWAALLPFSVIILNATLADIKEDVTRRLLYMKEEGALSGIPCWIVTAKHTFIETDYWQNQGISKLLLIPLSIQTMKSLCTTLTRPSDNFYSLHDTTLRQDFTNGVIELLPRIEIMLAAQVAQMAYTMEAVAEGHISANTADQAHAIKSAALNIGYLRLAALMGQIEYAARSRDLSRQNWAIIASCLKEALGAPQNPTQRGTVSS